MTVPVLRALTQKYPDLKITVLTRAFFKPFFRDLKNVDVYGLIMSFLPYISNYNYSTISFPETAFPFVLSVTKYNPLESKLSEEMSLIKTPSFICTPSE